MREKLNSDRDNRSFYSGYFKPKGRIEKRKVHKKLRKMVGSYRPGIMNAIGVPWYWS